MDNENKPLGSKEFCQESSEQMLPLVYQELRRLAARRLAKESPGQTLDATSLVHEAYLQLVGDVDVRWENRAHFFGAAAEAMRRILIDRARRKSRLKHGGEHQRLDFRHFDTACSMADAELLAIDEVLQKLENQDAPKAQLVKLRFFAGLNVEQAAEVMGISRATADRYWAFARAWLFREISKES